MKIFRFIVITIGFVALMTPNHLYSQSFEKGGFIMGGNITMNITDEKRYNLLHTDMNISYDLGYLITNRSMVGYRFSLILDNEKSKENYDNYSDWISYCYFKTKLTDPIFIEIYGGYGKYHHKYKTGDPTGAHDYHIADFGTGIQYHKFLSQKIVLILGISYDHFILFVKDNEEYFSNQHFNEIIFKIGLHYYFNNNQKLNSYETLMHQTAQKEMKKT